MDALKSTRTYIFLSLVVLLLHALPLAAAVGTVLFSGLGDTFGGEYVGQMKWSAVSVFRDGCVPDGKCESIADGKVWIDADTPDAGHTPKRISGKYEISLNGKHLEGPFVAKRHVSKHPLRLCM